MKSDKKVIPLICLCTTMFLIFSFSAQPGELSSQTSSAVRDFLQHLLMWIWPESASTTIFDFFWTYIRKFAHFTIYMILGVFAIWSAKCWLRWNSWKQTLISIFFCTFYAATDEFHQLFVPGRAGMIQDVLLDTAGSLVGITLTLIILYFRKQLKKQL